MELRIAATLPCDLPRCHPCATRTPSSREHFEHGNPFLSFSQRVSSSKSVSLHGLRSSRRVLATGVVNAAGAGCGLETLERVQSGVLGEHPDAAALREVMDLEVDRLAAAAARIRDKREDSDVVTFSPKVFIPLTRVCRDFCGYCTFAAPPRPGKPVYMSVDEVRENFNFPDAGSS
jgi:hypothetical protein